MFTCVTVLVREECKWVTCWWLQKSLQVSTKASSEVQLLVSGVVGDRRCGIDVEGVSLSEFVDMLFHRLSEWNVTRAVHGMCI